MTNIEGPPRGTPSPEKEERGKYNPVDVLREREIDSGVFGVDRRGREVIKDKDFAYIASYLRKNIQEGSVLNLGGGFMHCHRILPAIDKITHATSIDISDMNNQVVREFLEGSVGLGTQTLIDASDVAVMRTYAEALSQDPRFAVGYEGKELLAMLYEKSRRHEGLDVITADVIAQMEELGSGALLKNRTFDNVLFLWSIFTRDRDETLHLMENVKKLLSEGGRIVIMDVWEYSGVEEDGDAMHSEDQVVARNYPKPWIWTTEEFIDILEEVGFRNIRTEEKVVEESEEEEDAIGGYICIVAEA